MDISYYKEQHRSYMVIKKTEDESVIGYQRRMLETNHLDGILRANVRCVNGEDYTYYDITSRLTLKQVYGSRYMDRADLEMLFGALKNACDETDRYLLDVKRICLDPTMIFYSCTGNRYSFLYNISVPADETRESLSALMDYLLERVSPDDAEAGDIVYRLYEFYEKGGDDIWDILSLFDGQSDGEYEPDIKQCEYTEASEERIPERQGIVQGPASNGMIYDSVYESSEVNGYGLDEAQAKLVIRRADRIYPVAATAVGLVGIISSVAVYIFMYLNDDEKLILTGALVLSVIILGVGVFMLIKRHIRPSLSSAQQESESLITTVQDAAYEDIPKVNMRDFVSRSAAGIDKKHSVDTPRVDEPAKDRGTEDAQTVFFDDYANTGNFKLYALDRKNKRHIELDHFPYTIGKLAGYVDCCIDHPSVSRLHARVDRTDDRLVLSDLNSTNGVFLNGIKLSPNEQKTIENGDEIRFGSLNYCLRYSGSEA